MGRAIFLWDFLGERQLPLPTGYVFVEFWCGEKKPVRCTAPDERGIGNYFSSSASLMPSSPRALGSAGAGQPDMSSEAF